jgi:hypothetical protein
MKKSLVMALAVLGISNLSHSAWDAKSQNQLEMQVAKFNSVYDFARYVGEQTGQDLKANDYVAEVKLVTAALKDGDNSLPATFEVTLHARDKDGNISSDSVSAEMKCERGHTNQVSRFTRVTPVHCSMVQ